MMVFVGGIEIAVGARQPSGPLLGVMLGKFPSLEINKRKYLWKIFRHRI